MYGLLPADVARPGRQTCRLLNDLDGRPVLGSTLMKSVRGGAFNTYFACQATSDFRTGLGALFRVDDVGFRCAMEVVAGADV